LNLSTTLPKSIIDQAEKVKGLQYVDIDAENTTPSSSGSSRAWAKLGSALASLQESLSKQDGKTTTRIIINELGSADWEEPSSHVRLATYPCCRDADGVGDPSIPPCSKVSSEGSECSRYDHLTPFIHEESGRTCCQAIELGCGC
jgi:hypothetical protein